MESIVIKSEKQVDSNTKFRRIDINRERSKCSAEAVLLESDGHTSKFGVVVRYAHGKATPRVIYKAVIEVDGVVTESSVESHFRNQIQAGNFDADIRNAISKSRINKRRSRSRARRSNSRRKQRRTSTSQEVGGFLDVMGDETR